MVAVAGLTVSCLVVLGFYGYVLMQLYREHQRLKAQETHLREYLHALKSKPKATVDASKAGTLLRPDKHMRSDALIQVGIAVGGLLGVFAEIGFLSRLISSFH
jgi:hypothetical protein